MSFGVTEPGFTPTGPSETRFQNDKMRVDETPVIRPDGRPGTVTIVRPGTGLGVVAIPRATAKGVSYYGLVKQHRPASNSFTLEFPRGWATALTVEEAQRELEEEVGCEVLPDPVRLGGFYPEPGLMDTAVVVYLFDTKPQENMLFQEEKSGAKQLWVNDGTLTSLVTSGVITCGITLAAWAQLVASGQMSPKP
ncbi:hypothetical protein [Leifsonia sp. Leaf264]|uniref:hypothetical protein n=1 Tax=Leifsonia sp. Leaf264 TaxID=1736314 RepID=UPI0006F5FCD1|nr:hypothetical protein [Leifsonia sp. Leaf264]KQO98880.1 hypothetical protein ASF30_12520 [Leifsonia sp. Leaf264]